MPCHFFLESSQSGSSRASPIIPNPPSIASVTNPPPSYMPATDLTRLIHPLPHRRDMPRPPNEPLGIHSDNCPCHQCLTYTCLPRLIESLANMENIWVAIVIICEMITVLVRIHFTVQYLQALLHT